MDAPSFGRRATPPPLPDLAPSSTDGHGFGRPLTQQDIDEARRLEENQRKARDDRERGGTPGPGCDGEGPQDSILDALFRPRDTSDSPQEPGLFERFFGSGDGSDGDGGGGDGGGGGD